MMNPMSMGLRAYDQRSSLAMCVHALAGSSSCPSFFPEHRKPLCGCRSDTHLLDLGRCVQASINYDPDHCTRRAPAAYCGIHMQRRRR